MKRTAFILLTSMIFVGSVVWAEIAGQNGTAAEIAAVDLVDHDLAPFYVPDFLRGTTTSWICQHDDEPYRCSYDYECQSYFGLPSNYTCDATPGLLCSGHCRDGSPPNFAS